MAIYKKGSDPDALDRSAEVLVQYARECTAVRESVGRALGSLGANWGGDDLQALIRQWPAIEQQIDGLGTHLQTLGNRLTTNAAAQRGASGPTRACLPNLGGWCWQSLTHGAPRSSF